MKSGKSLTELAQELERQVESKHDYLADTEALVLDDGGSVLKMHNGDIQEFGITNHCHRQIGQRIGIPQKYYEKMRENAPELLARNVNHWFEKTPERRMVRTLDGRARAFLSDRYRPLDNFDLARAVLPKIIDSQCSVKSSELTETRMYIQAVTDRIQTEIKPGDVVQAGIVVSNSEVGAGSVKVEPMVFRLVCLNGMISADHSMKKYHVGRSNRGFELEGAAEFYRDATRQKDDEAFFMKVQDIVAAALEQSKFERIVDKMRESTEKRIEGNLPKVVEVAVDRFSLTQDEGGSIMKHLIEGGDLTQYGLMNAVTRTAEDVDSYDRAVELERLGGSIIELPQTDWKLISTAS